MPRLSLMDDLVRGAMMDVWRKLYDVQVLVMTLDPVHLADIKSEIASLSYKIFIAEKAALKLIPRGPRSPQSDPATKYEPL
jgi:hypothetical protein